MSDPEDPGGHRPALVSIANEQSGPVDTDHLQRIAVGALGSLGIAAELSIALVEPAVIADLKGRYYGAHASTDVLSFPMDGPTGPTLGDVVVCPAVAARQAIGLGISLQDELANLVVHGILHLLGRDHETPADEISMAFGERALLGTA